MYVDYILSLGVLGYYIECFIASILMAPPADFFYIPLVLVRPEKISIYALVGFILSVLGGITAYMLGKYGGRPIFDRLYKNKKEVFDGYVISYGKHAFSIVFGAALFIAPYNICAVASGVLHMNFKDFFVASVLGRFLRFLILALSAVLFGDTIKEHLFEIGCFFGFIFIPMLWIIEIRRIKKEKEKNNKQC